MTTVHSLLAFIYEDIQPEHVDYSRRLVSLVKASGEDALYVLASTLHWVATEYHSGVTSKGYSLLSTSIYLPAASETIASFKANNLGEVDALYSLLEEMITERALLL